MNAVSADTFYFLALFNERDAAHAKALRFDTDTQELVTTAWVLTEVGDALSSPENRPAFLQLVDTLRNSGEGESFAVTLRCERIAQFVCCSSRTNKER